MQDQRSFSSGRFALTIDGEFAGFVRKTSGGHIKGEVVEHNLGISNVAKKHLATITHEPLTMEISGGMGKPLWDWIQASFDKGFVQKNVELVATNFNNSVVATRVFLNSYISLVDFPSLDASSKDSFYFSMEITPETIRYEKGTGETLKGEEELSAKKWLCSNFRFELGTCLVIELRRLMHLHGNKASKVAMWGGFGSRGNSPPTLKYLTLKYRFPPMMWKPGSAGSRAL